jgi:amino acid transporter
VVNPARTVPRAILLALTVVAALYIGLQVVAQGVLGAKLAGDGAPLVSVATVLFGEWGARFLVLVTVLSATGYLFADMLSSPRVFHAMAERGQLPRRLAAVHPRLKTPALAIGVYAAMCATVASTGSFRQLALAAASGTAVVYLICCLGLLRLRNRHVAMTSAPFVAPGGALVPLGASAIIVWMLSTLSARELATAALLVAVSGIGYTLQAVWPAKAADPAIGVR